MRQLAAAVLLSAAAMPAYAQGAWSTFTAPRFGVVVSYPAMFDHRDPPPENGDGQVFRTQDRSAILTVFGSYSADALNQTNAGAMAAAKEEGVTYSYQQLLPTGFVLSGTKGSRIVYERCIIARPRMGCAELKYPASDARRWDATVSRISQSVRLLKE